MKLRAQAADFINGNNFFHVKTDVPNMRVTLLWGKIGTLGKILVRKFDSREGTRRYAASKINQRVGAGFVQVS